jgi:hypothetical protein
MPSTPEEYAANIEREEGKWSALVKKLASRSSSSSPAKPIGVFCWGIFASLAGVLVRMSVPGASRHFADGRLLSN